MLVFENGSKGRYATAQAPKRNDAVNDIPESLLRKSAPCLPEVSELQAVRHFTNLSRKNFSIDTQFYPLGSCTMKYNPKGAQKAAMLPGFIARHPLAPESHSQGYLSCVYDLQEILKEVTGMSGVSLSPMAGAQGEFAGVAMIKAYHEGRKDFARTEIIVPEAAHGTNPATAVMCGYKVKEIPVKADGDVDLEALKEAVGPQTAGIMMTNPSTCGVFERQVEAIAKTVHDAGGLLYYDGANLNAILGKVRPGDMGFDVLHMNLHKTFATPHGGGGPGSGPVAVGERLLPYLPTPIAGCEQQDSGIKRYHWIDETGLPDTIGRLSTFMGNAGIILRAYIYAVMLGKEGLHRVGEFSTLNANYMAKLMSDAGFELAYKDRRATHEFIITLSQQAKTLGVSAMDFAKRLLDYGYHAPTTYFPLLVPECFLIEPTETESINELEGFVEAMIAIQKEAENSPDTVRGAPFTQPVCRLDDVKAARELDVAYTPE